MRYGLGYALTHDICYLLSRTLHFYRRAEKEYLSNLLSSVKNKRVLDYGCNCGASTGFLKRLAPENEVCGADINLSALKLAKRRHPKIKFYEINDLFFEENKFDIIIISHVLEHVKDREQLIKNILRITSDEGKVIAIVPQERIRGDTNIPQTFHNFIRLRFENPHIIKLGYKDLQKLFDKVSFKITDHIYTNLLPRKTKSRNFFSMSLIVSASKA